MKLVANTAAIVLMCCSPALAGGEGIIGGESTRVQIQWGGAYAGGVFGLSTTEYTDGATTPGVVFSKSRIPTYGGFAGFNVSLGSNLVLGGEFAYGRASWSYPAERYDFESAVLDLKARGGFTLGNALFYGFGGYSRAGITYTAFDEDADFDGWNTGLGVDYLLTDNLFIGAEYIHRDIDLSSASNPWNDDDDFVRFDTVTLRLGWKF